MSALTNERGLPQILYDPLTLSGAAAPAFAATLVMDAAAEKVAFIGSIWHPTVKTGTINIRKVWFRLGAVTFNALSVFRVSLQNVSASAGPPWQPDGNADQTVSYAGTGLTANTVHVTANLSADRPVDLSADSVADADSRWVAVVFESTTFTAADSIVVSSIQATAVSHLNQLLGGPILQTAGTWALQVGLTPCVAFECDDGTFAFMQGAFPVSAFTTPTTANNATNRAIGVMFSVPTERKVDRGAIMLTIPNGCDGDLILYDSDGTTVLASVAIDNDAVSAAVSIRYSEVVFPPVTLAANTNYRLAYVPSTTTAATVYVSGVSAAGYMDGFILGQNAHTTIRDSTGTWNQTTTTRPLFGLGFSAFHDGASAGGGGQRVIGG